MSSQQQQRKEIEDDLNLDDLGEFEPQEPQPQASGASVIAGIVVKLEEAMRKVATNRIQWLLTVRDEKVRQGLLTADTNYTGGRSCINMVLKEQGPLAFWQGISVQAFQVATATIFDQIGQGLTIPLVFNGVLMMLPGGGMQAGNGLISAYAAYGVHELLLSFWTYPIQVIHVNVACQLPDPKTGETEGIFPFISRVRKTEPNGIRALYRGYSYEMLSRLIGLVIKVGYQMSQATMEDGSPEPQGLTLGTVLKVFLLDLTGSFIAYPLLLMGNRARMTVGADPKYKYQGIADLTNTILKGGCQDGNEGKKKSYSRLWSGFKFSAAASAVDVVLAVIANVVQASL